MSERFRSCRLLLSVLLCSLSLAFSGCAGGHPSAGNIAITADNGLLTAGASTQLQATSNSLISGSNDVTSKASWSSSNPAVATVTSTGYLTGVSLGTAIITASYEQASGSLAMAIGAPLTTTLTVTPANASVIAGGTQQYTAQATYANNTAANVSSTAQWSVAPASVGTISSTGLLSVLNPGTFTVTAVSGLKLAAVTGTAGPSALASISITPTNASMAGGKTQQFTATATYNNQTTADLSSSVIWTSSNTSLLTVSSTGLGTAIGNNPTTTVQLTATSGSVTATVPVTITAGAAVASLVVTPTSSSIAAGSAEQHTAIATYSDGTQQDVTGQVTWSATSSPSTSSTAVHSVHASLATPRDTANGVIDVNQSGVDTAMAPGTTAVQASLNGVQAQSVVIVTPATITSISIASSKSLFPVGAVQPLMLAGHFSDGTTQDLTLTANWQSSDPTIATVHDGGNATGVKAGIVQFTASFGSLTTTRNYTILPSTLLYGTLKAVTTASAKGNFIPFSFIGTYSDGSTYDLTSLATWSSANPSVLTIDKNGLSYSVAPGSTEVTGTVFGRSAAATHAVIDTTETAISLQPTSPTFALGTTNLFTSIASFTNGAQANINVAGAVFTSSDPTVFTIDSVGRAKAGRVGTATVTATHQGISQTSIPVQVTNATLTRLILTPNTAQIAALTNQQYKAVGFFSDGSVQDITADVSWSTEDQTVATVDPTGLVFSIAPGVTQIVASMAGQAVSCLLTVTNATLTSVAVTPGNAELPIGTSSQFSLTGTYSDGTMQDLSQQAIWASDTASITSITGQGVIIGSAIGLGNVSAGYGFYSASTPVNVTGVSLTSIALSPASTTLRVGDSQKMVATGTFSDGFTEDIGINATFNSDNPAIATILGGDSTAYAAAIGSAQLNATFRGITASTTTFTVLSGTLTSIALTPANPSLVAGSTLQLSATGTYADGSTADFTKTVLWTSSNAALASVDANGLLTVSPSSTAGSVSITATQGPASASTTVIFTPTGTPVSTATLTAVTITPTSSHLAYDTTNQLTATGTYSDGSTADLTTAVVWSSSNTAIAIVSNRGLVTALAPGSGTIQATAGSLASQSAIIVSAATLQSLSISPSGATFAPGTAQQFTLTGTFSDGTTQTLFTGVTWTSSNSAVATISATGNATGVGPGPVQFTASYNGRSVTSSIENVSPATLVSISVSPSNVNLAKGTNQQFTVFGTYSDGSTRDITHSAAYTSSSPAVLSVTSTGLATAAGIGTAQITVSSGGVSFTTQPVSVTAATLSSIAITPTNPTLAAGTMQQFTATGIFSDGTTQDLSNEAVWTSSSPQVIAINQYGNATGNATGSAQISAALNGITGVTGTVHVNPATLTAIILSPATAQIAKGSSQQFTATGVFTDGSSQDLSGQVTWTSSNGEVAGIDASGLATGTGVGSAQITAAAMGRSATTSSFTVTPATLVSLSFNPASPTVASGTTAQIMVIGHYSDGTTQDLTGGATFSSSNTLVATINSSGTVMGLVPGSSTITVQAGGQTSSFDVTVSAALLSSIAISPTNPGNLPIGTNQQFTATGTFSDGSTQNLSTSATWSSSNSADLTVSSSGLATAIALGTVTVSASYQTHSATTDSFAVTPAVVASITVAPQNVSVSAGNTQQFTASANYTDSTSQNVTNSVTWSSSNASAATISPAGLASAIAAGASTIAAQYNSLSGSSTLTVTAVPPPTLQSIAVTPASGATVAIGSTLQFTATGTYSNGTTANLSSQVTWTSSNTGDATVSNTGLASGVASGSITIQASSGTLAGSAGLSVVPATAVLQSISVTPPAVSLLPAGTQQFTATGHYSDNSVLDLTAQATWTSSNTTTAQISAAGLATGLAPGSTTISAAYNTITGTASLSVTAPPTTLQSISISPTSATIVTSANQQFTATGHYSDNSTQNLTSAVTWTSSTSAASINSSGLANGLNPGSTTIGAAYEGLSASATLTVTLPPVILNSIAVTPATATINKAATQQFTAMGAYSDGSTQDISTSVTWSSSVSGIASIDTNGLATGHQPGMAQIQATLSGQTGSATLTVNPAPLISIAVTPATSTVAAGTAQQYKAVGTYSDGSTQDLTSSVSWSSSNTAEATINASGLASTTSTGSVTLTAQSGTVSATATLTISAATASSLQITPSAISNLPAGDVRQLMTTATFSDGSSQNVTTSATYTSSNSAVATVDHNGVLTAAGPGSATITATLGTATATLPATISNAALTSITVTPANPSLPAGQSQQLTATGTYSDGSTQDLTNTVTWSSSSPSAIPVSATGDVTVMSPGTATITATHAGVSGTDTVTGTSAVVSSIAVSPASATLVVGSTQQFAATATYSDGSQQTATASAHWSVTDPSKATIANGSSAGLLTANAAGSLSAQATIGGVTGSASVTITAATLSSLTINPSAVLSLPAGTTKQLSVTAAYSDGSNADVTNLVTWTTGQASTAYVDATGLLHGIANGVTTIDAHLSGVDGTAAVTVSNATLSSITVTPAAPSLALGQTLQMIATGTYSDGTSANLTSQVQWTSGAPAVASISNAGLVTTLTTGVSILTASLNSTSGHTSLTVTSATLQSITVSSAQPSFALGQSLPLKATGFYSDGSQQDLTNSVTWSSAAPSVGVVSSTGSATGVSPGTFNARATSNGITGSESIVVTNATLVSIAVTPNGQTIVDLQGTTVQFTATGTFSNGTTQNLTGNVHWATTGVVVGTISQSGVFSPTGAGVGTVTATQGTITGSASLTVVAVPLL